MVAQVVLEEEHFLHPVDALDRLESLEDRSGVEMLVEAPAVAVGSAEQRGQVAGERRQGALANEVVGMPGARGDKGGDRDALIRRGADLDGRAEDSALVEISGD